MHDFEYTAPTALREAARLLAANPGSARLLAGGTDLIVFMRSGRQRPELVIDAKHIPELTRVHVDGDALTLGAAVSCRSISKNAAVAARFPALADATSLIGGIQIQGRATVGGNLCNASPSADTVPALIAYGAVARIVSARGNREVAVETFCAAPGRTVLADDELLVSLVIPIPAPRSGAKFLRFIPRNEMDIAVANAAAAVELDESGKTFRSARIAIGAVAPTPLLVEGAGAALVDQPVGDAAIDQAARLARDAARPIDDMRGTVEHRKQLVEVLTARALRAAVERARRAAA